jgi:hypothetical protein
MTPSFRWFLHCHDESRKLGKSLELSRKACIYEVAFLHMGVQFSNAHFIDLMPYDT